MDSKRTDPSSRPMGARTDDLGRRFLPWLVAVAFFMESLDTTILNTAAPAIATALDVVPLSMKAVLSSYTLSLAVFIPISGWVADRFGTRLVFASAIGLFTLGSFLCGLCTGIHELVACRILQGCGVAMMIPVGRIAIVRTFARSELIRTMSFIAIPGLVGPMLGPIAGGVIVGWFHWRVIFFINIPIGLMGLYLVHRHLPDYRETKRTPLDIVGMILFGSGIALLSYVLEIFGETSLSGREMVGLLAIATALLAGYGLHTWGLPNPLLRLNLLRVRTFRAAVTGGFVTRLGIGGIPFLFPLLYQVGLGFTPIQSGLMLMPQAFAAMSLKLTMPRILARFGYRRVLISNTIMIGAMIALFSTIGLDTPVWLVVIEVFAYGFFASLQYTSMNTLAYADVNGRQTSHASTIASTLQQLSISFGVAAASLVTAAFIPDRFHATPAEMIHGIHLGFLVLGALTVVSTAVFAGLKNGDGDAVSRPKAVLPGGP